MQIYLISALLFLLAIAIFVFQNTAVVTVKFLNWVSPDISLAVVVLMAACTGAIITFLVNTFRSFKIARQTREIIAENRKLQNEINKLKPEKINKNKTTSENNHSEDNSEKN
ncbi:MAG: lipopolysaccharide assembly protein LapA domain-containing protein [Syntrophomonadaceae bacterium]|nr:lipopolysaccharide assembly protein LapA domain-containing protein [Syntrophomonadaceae bacterium]MDD4548649.1 lipopolysaccharide assembly protein LapA domain-containing protein [Syntrophomonadaceae bacterium]